MKNGYVLGLFIVPIFLEGCCMGNQKKTKVTDIQQAATHQHYRAVEGEVFVMPCNGSMKGTWTRTGEGTEGPSYGCGEEFLAKEKHTGNYTHRLHVNFYQVIRSLLSSGSRMFFYLQVVGRASLSGCFHPEEIKKYLRIGQGGKVSCPGLNCSNNTNVTWYKHIKKSKGPRDSRQNAGWLELQVREVDTGVYFCDRQIIEKGVMWTFRRAVNVTTIARPPSEPPSINKPNNYTPEEVEIGRSYTLLCEVSFPSELEFSREVQWYVNYGGNVENRMLLHMEKQQEERTIVTNIKVTRRAIIKEVTRLCLNHTYTCIASNDIGSVSFTVKLKEQIKEKDLPLAASLVTFLVLVTGLGVILHLKWLEIQLIYRSHIQHGKNDGAEKEFDVFLSYVWSPPSAEVRGVLTTDEEEHLSSTDLLNTEESKANQKLLEVLLPKVLEGRWGYRVFLLERDVLPGGAYTNDVVLAIQRSRMLICLLSADYLSNSNAVFVLESGVQALLQNSAVKLLLIWTSRASASHIQPDPPLPTLVQRALKVLPSLDWTSGKPTRATSNFWKSLRKAMPDHRVKLVSPTQDQSSAC